MCGRARRRRTRISLIRPKVAEERVAKKAKAAALPAAAS